MSASPGYRSGVCSSAPQAQLVTYPHCGQKFPLSDALAEELARHVLAGKGPSLRAQIAKDVSALYGNDLPVLPVLQDRQREQDDTRRHDADIVKKLRDDEITLRQERRMLESEQDALRLEKERMGDEIRVQECTEADRRAQERTKAELLKRNETHSIQIREMEDKLKRVNEQLDQHAERARPARGRKKASAARTCSPGSWSGASRPTRSPPPRAG